MRSHLPYTAHQSEPDLGYPALLLKCILVCNVIYHSQVDGQVKRKKKIDTYFFTKHMHTSSALSFYYGYAMWEDL